MNTGVCPGHIMLAFCLFPAPIYKRVTSGSQAGYQRIREPFTINFIATRIAVLWHFRKQAA